MLNFGSLLYTGSPAFWRFMATSPIALWFISLFVIYSDRYGLYDKQDGFLFRYARPMQHRVGFAIFAASLPYGAWWIGRPSLYWPLDVLLLGATFLGLYLSGPSEVCINLDERIYTARQGWPIVPKSWHGSMEEISGVKVAQNSRNYTWTLSMYWRTRNKRVVLGQFPSRKKAEGAAMRVIDALGLANSVPHINSYK